ncbi:hypothetical protein VTN02DRAFT_2142 [Thermoascus thermophilus]
MELQKNIARGLKIKKPRLKRFGKYSWLTQGTGSLIKTIESAQIPCSGHPITSSSPFDLLCTYNWRDARTPSIYVPGAPPRWEPRNLPVAIPQDRGKFFIDEDAYRASEYPFEPLFQALSVMNPNFNFQDVDLVTNRNSLRKLFDFAEGRTCQSFRIDLNLVNETLFLTRRERKARTVLRGTNRSNGFGHGFEQMFSKRSPPLEDSSGHYRVITYPLGPLKCVIRFEVDAYCDSNDDLPPQGQASPASSDESVAPSPESLSLQERETRETPGSINVIRRGHVIPCAATAEIKSRSKFLGPTGTMPQLWFGRTPHLLCGIHKDGVIEQIKERNCAPQFQEWEVRHQTGLRKLVQLIEELRQTTTLAENRSCVAVFEKTVKPSVLKIFSFSKTRPVLPKAIIARYWRDPPRQNV